jgi:hypothetical protein
MFEADKEGFGEATLGEAQSSNPPSDPEMIYDDAERSGNEGDVEEQTGDTDTGPAVDPDQIEADEERDQAEG